jgi:hypothetical protein
LTSSWATRSKVSGRAASWVCARPRFSCRWTAAVVRVSLFDSQQVCWLRQAPSPFWQVHSRGRSHRAWAVLARGHHWGFCSEKSGYVGGGLWTGVRGCRYIVCWWWRTLDCVYKHKVDGQLLTQLAFLLAPGPQLAVDKPGKQSPWVLQSQTQLGHEPQAVVFRTLGCDGDPCRVSLAAG